MCCEIVAHWLRKSSQRFSAVYVKASKTNEVEIVQKDACVCLVCEERKAKLERNFPEFSLNLHEHMVFRYIL